MSDSTPTIILAPLQGFTDMTFRNVYSDHFKGVDEAVAPFISTMGQQRLKPSRIKDVLPENNRKMPVVPQILSNVAKDFIFLARHLYDIGYSRVNWNLGCPHSKIAKKKRGSGLLPHPEMIDSILSGIIPAIPNTLSVKVRLGRKSKIEINELIPVFNRHNLDEIILHPRTGIQMYEGTSDHDAFGSALEQSRHPFTYNGDIRDLESFDIVQKKFETIRRFMIGRGILSNPFLPEQIKKHNEKSDFYIRLKDFHTDLFDHYRAVLSGPGHLTGRMKGFWKYLGPSFRHDKKHLKQIFKAQTTDTYLAAVDRFFDQGFEYFYQK